MITGGNYEPFETINDKSKIKDLIQKFKDKQSGLIQEFINAFVLFHKDNTYNEYQQLYTTSKKNLDDQNAEMYDNVNILRNNINKLHNKIAVKNDQIGVSAVANNATAVALTNLDSTNNSSQILIDNSKEMYKDQYINNVTKVLGIFIIIYLFFKVFSKSQTNLNT
jgi:predicted RND superfamily exporter protein